MKGMLVAVAPQMEQVRIIKTVNELISTCEELNERIFESKNTQLRMSDAMSERALP